MQEAVNLSQAKTGQRVLIIGVEAGRGALTRLESMGLVPGVELEVLSASGRGPLLVGFEGGRVIVERGIADKVQVL